MTDWKLLAKLAEPFPDAWIRQPPKGKHGEYVNHADVTQRLLSIVGLFDFEQVEVHRGYAPAVVGKKGTKENPTWPARDNAIVAVTMRLSVWTDDGAYRSVEEVGIEDDPAMHHDGENLKNATSDAMKRCAMRLGLGLHLWCKDDEKSTYFLAAQLAKDHGEPSESEPATDGGDLHPAPLLAPGLNAVADLGDQVEQAQQADDPELDGPTDPEGRYEVAARHWPWESDPARLEQLARGKCKGACRNLDPYESDTACCTDAYLRRVFTVAEDLGLVGPMDGAPDPLHRALGAKGHVHVADMKVAELREFTAWARDKLRQEAQERGV